MKRTVEVKEKETINPRERGSEYEQITNAVRGYDKIPEHEVVDERDSGLFLGWRIFTKAISEPALPCPKLTMETSD